MDKINCIKSVRLVHPSDKVKMYEMTAAFLEFIGICVYESVGNKNTDNFTDLDHEIKTDDGLPEDKLTQEFRKTICDMTKTLSSDTTKDTINAIMDVSLRHDLMRAEYAKDYFGDIAGKYPYIYEQLEESHERFKEALGELTNLGKQPYHYPGTLYVQMAKTSCKLKMNEIYTILWNAIQDPRYAKTPKEKGQLKGKLYKRHYYNMSEINADVERILAQNPNFHGAYIAKAAAVEIDDEEKIESVLELKRAIRSMDETPLTSDPYYHIGQYCEYVRNNIDTRIDYYKKAYESDKQNYRALSKLAEHAAKEKNHDEAIRLWNQTLGTLIDRQGLPPLRPVEQAYLYRSYLELGRLYAKRNEMPKAVRHFMQAENVYNDTNNENAACGFYPWMFGDNDVSLNGHTEKRWEIYKNAAKEKLRIDDVYIEIIKAAAKMDNQTLYDEYTEKRKEIQA